MIYFVIMFALILLKKQWIPVIDFNYVLIVCHRQVEIEFLSSRILKSKDPETGSKSISHGIDFLSDNQIHIFKTSTYFIFLDTLHWILDTVKKSSDDFVQEIID